MDDGLHRIGDLPQVEIMRDAANELRTGNRTMSQIENRLDEAKEEIRKLRQELSDERKRAEKSEKISTILSIISIIIAIIAAFMQIF